MRILVQSSSKSHNQSSLIAVKSFRLLASDDDGIHHSIPCCFLGLPCGLWPSADGGKSTEPGNLVKVCLMFVFAVSTLLKSHELMHLKLKDGVVTFVPL